MSTLSTLKEFTTGRPSCPGLRAARFLPAALIMAWIFYASSRSMPPGLDFARAHMGATLGQNNSLHFLLYAALAAALVWGLWPLFTRARWPFLLAWAISTVYGALDELHQMGVPRRCASGYDMLRDTVGAGVMSLVLAGGWLGLKRLTAEHPSSSKEHPTLK